ncbi:hypothetical protein [Cohnella sp. JJ-181]|uniref:hypothetical protein n=1 Tax=Cohnella rhizoplanae TaxID=2974897 RepID=UPI0022FF88C0|nr:hypothetical protein [Cohnella sp. JJ-181]CAI6073625.1 hypothetical protein COHCIP112018_02393 [Cohnella sp. JJ-181]
MSGLDGKGTTFPGGVNGLGVSLVASATFDPSSLVDGAGVTSSPIMVPGAAFGDFVQVAAPYDLQDITATAYVSAANTVEIRLQNESGATVDLASGKWRVLVLKGLGG